ncbi:MAG: 1-deoxy-D-xylulose-5-phosphate reductoisomerase [Thermomicrobiales bacterium]
MPRIGIALLGSTGSVGRQTLDVIDAYPSRFRIIALAARSVSPRFLDQVARYHPEIGVTAQDGPQALIDAATHPDVDIVVVATAGHVAIAPTVAAISDGKTIAIANKETLVCAGEIIMPLARANGVSIHPVDSEHSAIWQVLDRVPPDQIARIILTASGGPFRATSMAGLAQVTAQDALAHPTWSMGGKITIDSATMMNKGLEIIEAHWLFAMPYERIDVVIHPESVVHSLVEFVDGSQIAQLGLPDMRLPIQFALTYPERLPSMNPRLRLENVGQLSFAAPDIERFPALRLARDAGIRGGLLPTVLSAADEIAVEAFLAGRIRFTQIAEVVEGVLQQHDDAGPVTLESIAASDVDARRIANLMVSGISER